MKKRFLIILLAIICPLLALGRAVRVLDLKTLIAKSKLVFVGRVKSIEPSGITTTMSYSTWRGVTFEWLGMEVKVLEPIKGVKKGDRVRTMMLSADRVTRNGPGLVEAEEGNAYLLCLAPTTISNVFAALTAPWDDRQAIFVLDREFWLYKSYWKRRHSGTLTEQQYNSKYDAVWSLVDDEGNILPEGVEAIRKEYDTEIKTAPARNAIIYLEWKTQTSPSGWQRDVPKGYSNSTNSKVFPRGPTTMPGKAKKEE